MIEIVPGKWGYFHQIIFNANKTTFESLFYFPQAPAVLSYIIPRPFALLGLDLNQVILLIEN